MLATTSDGKIRGGAALASIYGGVNPSPLPPLGHWASRLALCARVLPEVSLGIPSATVGGQH